MSLNTRSPCAPPRKSANLREAHVAKENSARAEFELWTRAEFDHLPFAVEAGAGAHPEKRQAKENSARAEFDHLPVAGEAGAGDHPAPKQAPGVATADAQLVFLPGEHGRHLAMPRRRAAPQNAEAVPGADGVLAEQREILSQIDKRIAEREARGAVPDRSKSQRGSFKQVDDEDLLREIALAREEQEDDDFHTLYMTQDVYSMAIFAGAGYCGSELAMLWIFFVTLVCFGAQVGSLILAIVDLQPDDTSLICCTRLLGHPVNVSVTVRAGQWLAVMFSIFSLENIICIDTLAFINAIVSKVPTCFELTR